MNTEEFKTCLGLSEFQYDLFVEYEDAIEWLSDGSELKGEG